LRGKIQQIHLQLQGLFHYIANHLVIKHFTDQDVTQEAP